MAFSQPEDSGSNSLDGHSNSSDVKTEDVYNTADGSNSGYNDDVSQDGEGKKRKLDEADEGNEEDSTDASPAKKPHMDKEVRKLLPELEKFWSTVEQDPSDFTAWTHLLQYVDQTTNISVASEAYDAFLSKYPYCYGYWKKYADYAKRRGSISDVEQIFKRGLRAIPLSVDLWIHYLTYVKSTHPEDEDFIRSQFDEGIEACGLEFRSDKLWEQYVQFEMEVKNYKRAMKVWDSIIETPTQALKKHFEKMLDFVNDQDPLEVLSNEEMDNLTAEIQNESNEGGDEDMITKLRSKMIERRTQIYENTSDEVKMRGGFEDGIKRPYFHVKPVEKNQLRNWIDYLDFEISRGNLKRIITLFERCLIACAMYAEYWEKYLQFLQSQTPIHVSKVEEVFDRVTRIHHPKIYKFNLDYAAFEEIQGKLERASSIYDDVIGNSRISNLQVIYRQIQFERRQNNLNKCMELFQKYIKDCEDKNLSVHLTIKYARFLKHYLGSYVDSVEVLKGVLEEEHNSKPKVLMALVDIGLHATPMDMDLILYAFDYGIKNLGREDCLAFTRRKLEFLEDFGNDIESVQITQNKLQSLLKSVKEEQKTEPVSNSVKVLNSETVKVSGGTTSESGSYDYNGSSGSYSSYGSYPQGQYGSSDFQPTPSSDPSVYGQSYVNQPSSWNSFYA